MRRAGTNPIVLVCLTSEPPHPPQRGTCAEGCRRKHKAHLSITKPIIFGAADLPFDCPFLAYVGFFSLTFGTPAHHMRSALHQCCHFIFSKGTLSLTHMHEHINALSQQMLPHFHLPGVRMPCARCVARSCQTTTTSNWSAPVGETPTATTWSLWRQPSRCDGQTGGAGAGLCGGCLQGVMGRLGVLDLAQLGPGWTAMCIIYH